MILNFFLEAFFDFEHRIPEKDKTKDEADVEIYVEIINRGNFGGLDPIFLAGDLPQEQSQNHEEVDTDKDS